MLDDIKNAMAKAYFASAYADAWEEAANADLETGLNPSGCDWMDLIPDEMDSGAMHAAIHLITRMQRVNNGLTIENIFNRAQNIHARAKDKGDREFTPEMFGHYCAMQAMGHGVGLADAFGRNVYEAVKVPYGEFSSFDLERTYFPVPEEGN